MSRSPSQGQITPHKLQLLESPLVYANWLAPSAERPSVWVTSSFVRKRRLTERLHAQNSELKPEPARISLTRPRTSAWLAGQAGNQFCIAAEDKPLVAEGMPLLSCKQSAPMHQRGPAQAWTASPQRQARRGTSYKLVRRPVALSQYSARRVRQDLGACRNSYDSTSSSRAKRIHRLITNTF